MKKRRKGRPDRRAIFGRDSNEEKALSFFCVCMLRYFFCAASKQPHFSSIGKLSFSSFGPVGQYFFVYTTIAKMSGMQMYTVVVGVFASVCGPKMHAGTYDASAMHTGDLSCML